MGKCQFEPDGFCQISPFSLESCETMLTLETMDKVEVLGVRIHKITRPQLIEYVVKSAQQDRKTFIAYVNTHALNLAYELPWYRDFLNATDLVYCDGLGVILASKIIGKPMKKIHRMTGPDYLDYLALECEKRRLSLFLLGGKRGVVEKAITKLRQVAPGLRVSGHHGYFQKNGKENEAIIDRINLFNPQILIVGFGVPLQEKWVQENSEYVQTRVFLPLGACLDFYTGTLYRGPRFLTDHGMEWLVRLAVEPRRLWKRYLIGNPLFFLRVAWERLGLISITQSRETAFRKTYGQDEAVNTAPPLSRESGLLATIPALDRTNVLGIGVHATNMSAVLKVIDSTLESNRKDYVCVTGVHGIMVAQKDAAFKKVLNGALVATPDGMPTVWMGRIQGFSQTRRIYGPDLMIEACRMSVLKGYTHFIYGGKQGVAEELRERLSLRFPGIKILGTFTPPFRPLNAEEQKNLIETIKELKPDIFWVGLSTPIQEKFMAEYINKLDTKLMIGVGAAFDIHTGRLKDAPDWMKNLGMQWLHRLFQEPRRLWKRYLLNNPIFLFKITLQLLGIRKYHLDPKEQIEIEPRI